MKLVQKVVFVFLLALGFAWNCHAQTWTFVQEALNSYCVPGASSCSFSTGTVAPTTAGTVRVIFIRMSNSSGGPPASIISSVSGAGSTWNLCPNCHITSGNDALDMAYAIGGSGGQTNITVNLSGGSGNQFFTVYLYEFLPPAGATASYDNSGTNNSACSGGSCKGVSLAVSATDLILQGRGRGDPASFNSYGPAYIQLPSNNAISLNNSTGAAPAVASSASVMIFNAIAFKSTAGTFTPPAAHMKAVNYTNNNNAQPSCSPSCTLTIPSTTVGNLLYLEAADLNTAYISNVSGGGSWVVPTGANTCRNSMSGGYTLSCAYVLSMTSSVSSLNITMTGSGVVAFAVMEIQPINGTFSLDAQGSTINSPSLNPPGQSLTLSGSDDAIFQTIFVPGGTTAYTYYSMPPSAPKTLSMFFNNEASFVAMLDAPYGAFPANASMTWGDQQNNTTLATGVAFKFSSGTATAPNPPTSLTAVVH